MANNLTGAFDAVVQLAVQQINGLLATLHQRGADENAPLKLLHSASLRIGDPTKRPPDVGEFGEWVLAYQTERPPLDSHDLRDQLTDAAPPGAAERLRATFDHLQDVVITQVPVRGRVKVQLSSATLSVPSGSTSKVTVHAHVRAHYYPDPETGALPAPIHGEVQAVFDVRNTGTGANRKLLIKPSSQDSEIQFIAAPGSGLSAADAGALAAQVRKALREGFTLVPVDLPSDFPFADFKGVGAGASQAVALPLQLSSTPAPPGGIQSISQSCVGTAGFAFGIGREFVKSVFQPTIDRLLQFKQDFTISVPIWWDPTYHFSVTGVDLQFNDRNIDLIIRGKAVTSNFGWPNYNNIVIKQRFALLMLFDTLFIQAGDYEPEVSGLASKAVSSVKNAVIAQRNQALPPAQEALNKQLRDAKTRLTGALRSFLGPSSSAAFRAGFSEDAASSTSGGIQITTEGVIIRGDIKTGVTPMVPIVEITEIERGRTYSAFKSWIPGGRIDRLVWSWVEQSPIVAWGGQVKTLTDEHRFLLSIPPPQSGPGPLGAKVVGNVCLRLEGSRILADGTAQPVGAGAMCLAPEPDVVMEVPSWWEPVTVPVWLPDLHEGAILKDAIAAHVTVQTDTPRKDELTRNTLVYFADWKSADPLGMLSNALARLQRKSISLAVIVVLPAGAFGVRRQELEGKLTSITERFPVPVQVTEDDEGGWTRTFAVEKVPSTYLINARRQFVWSDEGYADPDVLAKALDKYITPAPIPKPRPLRLTVSSGDRAPDALFHTDRDEQIALHRMRGRRMLLNFWQSWSEPCLKELSRLQKVYEAGGKAPSVIMAFHGGKEGKGLDEIRKRLGLSFALVQDSEQQIARKYGVRCWPTTISIDEEGHVEHVQFGVATARETGPVRSESSAI
jgi:peroxiredoxin